MVEEGEQCDFDGDNLVRQESVALFKAAGNYVQQVRLQVRRTLLLRAPCTQPQKLIDSA